VLEEQIRMGGSPWWELVLAVRYVVIGSVLCWAALRLLRMERDIASLKDRTNDTEATLGAIVSHVATEALLVDIERQAMAQDVADREAGIYDVKQ
jgi:hypothetical protein